MAGEAARADLTDHLVPPFGVVDLAAFDRNAAALERRAAGTPLRVATKSVRCRTLLARVLARPGWTSALAFTLPEALWLVGGEDGAHYRDVLVAYPTADVAAVRRLAHDPEAAAAVTVMADSVEHLDLLADAARGAPAPVRVCLDLDASLRLAGGRVHLGARRSPLHDPADARALAEEAARRPGLRLVGVMSYEAQIAGLPDDAGALPRRLAVRAVQRLSARELAERRAAAVSAVREVADLAFVNGGGTGSLESTVAEGVVTDVAAGSGLLGPRLFDDYRGFRPEPAAWFVLPVVRRPAPGVATVLGGGWVASGPAGEDRLPAPSWPPGLRLLREEGAGEVQTPVVGPGADALRVGDRVWFRHAKAGELCEHLDALHLLPPDGSGRPPGASLAPQEVVRPALTYRGEGQAFL